MTAMPSSPAPVKIHFNGHRLRAHGRKPAADREPPLAVRRGRRVAYAREVVIRDIAGAEVASIFDCPPRVRPGGRGLPRLGT